MQYLTAEEILRIHSAIVDETGGSHGVRDRKPLEVMEALPQLRSFGKELYPTVFLKAGLYVRNIIMSHPFIDGNKRTAISAADVFMQLNGYQITIARGGVEAFALDVIQKKLDLDDIAAWLKKNSKKIRKGR